VSEHPGKKRLLFGFKSIPYPLRADGVSVRYLPILEYLGRRHEIDLIVIDGRMEKEPLLEGLRPHCRKIVYLRSPRRTRHRVDVRAATYLKFLLPWTPPLSVTGHGGTSLTRQLVEAAAGERYDAAVWVGGDMLPHMLNAAASMAVARLYVDFIDSPYLWAVRREAGVFGVGPIDRYERWKTKTWERKVVRETDGTIYISRVDADAVPVRNGLAGKRRVIPNGINLPDETGAPRALLPTPNIGFLGTMGYAPNAEAVEWLHAHVFLPLKDVLPELSLVVIGRYPTAAVRELGKKPGVIVTGEVADIWEYIHSVDVFVFPLLRGAGLKNKVLEAMYARRPVLTTAIGNEGIDAVSGEQLVLCAKGEEFQREALRLLRSPEERIRLGTAASTFVSGKFAWDPILAAYEAIVLGEGAPS